jgi:hypothetical protein
MAIPAIGGIIGSFASSAGSSAGGKFFDTPGADPGGWAFKQMQQRKTLEEDRRRFEEQLELEKIRAGLIQQQTGMLKDGRSDRQLFRNAMLGI